MRNKHTFGTTVDCRCPFEGCGKEFRRKVNVTYWTNQKGDVIDERIE